MLRTIDTKTCKRLHKPQGIKSIEGATKNSKRYYQKVIHQEELLDMETAKDLRESISNS